jgi:hypothetical protein
MHHARHDGRGLTRSQRFQRDGPQAPPELVECRPEGLSKGFLILAGYLEVDGAP